MALTLAIGFLSMMRSCSSRTPSGGWKRAKSAFERHSRGARNQLYDSCDDDLAGGGVPAVGADAGVIGESSAMFSITIIVSIFASGIVSLTLTPMMCSRFLASAGGLEEDDDQKFSLDVEHRVLRVYGSSLTWFCGIAGFRLLTWVVCLFGTLFCSADPKTFLRWATADLSGASFREHEFIRPS